MFATMWLWDIRNFAASEVNSCERGIQDNYPPTTSHEVAAQLGIDRQTIAARMALQIDYGCVRCALCEELGLTGGLSFTETKDMLEYPPPWNDEV